MRTLALAWRQLRRDLAAGDIRILFAALVLAVVAVTSVGFVTDRAERALAIEAMSVKSRQRVLAVPRWIAVTIFSASTM